MLRNHGLWSSLLDLRHCILQLLLELLKHVNAKYQWQRNSQLEFYKLIVNQKIEFSHLEHQ